MAVSISAADLDWCKAVARGLLEDNAHCEARYPIVNRGVTKWRQECGTPPEESVRGTHPREARGFTVAVPARFPLMVWRQARATPAGGWDDLESYVAGVVLHELVHHRQDHGGALPELADPPTDLEFLDYYEHALEREAHGAQIAYALKRAGLAASEATVFANRVGRRIAERLAPLAATAFAARAADARHALAAEVEGWLARLP